MNPHHAQRRTCHFENLQRSGETAATLVLDEVRPASFHTADWDGRNSNGRRVSSGVYLYQGRFGGRVETRKMALVR